MQETATTPTTPKRSPRERVRSAVGEARRAPHKALYRAARAYSTLKTLWEATESARGTCVELAKEAVSSM